MEEEKGAEIQLEPQGTNAGLANSQEDDEKGSLKTPITLKTGSKGTKNDSEDEGTPKASKTPQSLSPGMTGSGHSDDAGRSTTLVGAFKENAGKCDAICYLLFLCVFTAMAVLGRTASDYNYTQTESIRQKLTQQDYFTPWNGVGEKTYLYIGNIEEIYIYVSEVLFPTLFNEMYNNGSQILDPNKRYYVNSNARVLGGVRIKQYRVKEESSCEVEKKDYFPKCFNEDQEDTSDFYGNGQWNPDSIGNDSSSALYGWGELINPKYRSSDGLDDQNWRGKFGTYSGGGFVVDFPLNLTYAGAVELLELMQDAEWIDAGTRGLFIDFNTFNPSTVLHTVARLAFEMPTGGVFPMSEIKTWKFFRYKADGGTALAVLHVFFLLFVVGYSVQIGMEMYQDGVCVCICKKENKKPCAYWSKTKWRWHDCIMMTIFYCLIGVFVANDTAIDDDINLTEIWDYQSYRSLQYLFLAEVYLQALAGFLLFIKLFKYLGVNKRFKFLFTMLSESSQNLLMFFVVLFVIFSAFGMAGFLIFSSDVDDFRTFFFSLSNMLRYTVTQMDYTQLSQSSRLWGSGYYFFWSLLMLLVLANVFIAILAEAYTRVIDTFDPDSKLGAGLFGLRSAMSKVANVIKSFGAPVRHEDIDADGDGQVTAEELARKYGLTVDEAKDYISRFDTDGDGQLNMAEFEKVIEEQLKEKERMEREAEAAQLSFGADGAGAARAGGVSMREFNEMKHQMEAMQQLLRTTLMQSAAGKRALRGLENDKTVSN